MESDIFHDGTIYTGSAGLGMFYLMCSLNKSDDHELLKVGIKYTLMSITYIINISVCKK